MTKSRGTLKMRSTLSKTWCRVVMTSRMLSDTDARTRKKNMAAEPIPCFVILRLFANILKVMIGSPGVTTLKIAGITINSEKIGMKRNVRLKNSTIGIPENIAKISVIRYIPLSSTLLFVASAQIISNTMLIHLNRGSHFCRKPFLDAISSFKIVSLSIEITPKSVRLMKPSAFRCDSLLRTFHEPFFASILPSSHATPTQSAIPMTAEIIYAKLRCPIPFSPQPLKA